MWTAFGLSGLGSAAAVDSGLVDTRSELEARSVGVYRPIKAASGNLCLEPVNGRVVLNTCDPNKVTQFWGPFRDRSHVYRFQNRATVDCMWLGDGPSSGSLVVMGGCTLSDGSGNPPSNTEWDIGVDMPPATARPLRSLVGGNTNLCITAGASGLVTANTCNGANAQVFILGTD
ncbi:hypothetical protein GQ53DRAFT_760609 [Thozetella sp. PMI_491]|nr:hypothetical protein GQ53DRAFT_760609 [Thozetella sp. PMI_491]